MGMKKFGTLDAANRLLAGERIEHELFMYKFMHSLVKKHGIKLDVLEAEKIYDFFYDHVASELDPNNQKEIGLYDEKDDKEATKRNAIYLIGSFGKLDDKESETFFSALVNDVEPECEWLNQIYKILKEEINKPCYKLVKKAVETERKDIQNG